MENEMKDMRPMIEEAVKNCLDKADAGEYKTKNEVLDALIADIEALRETEGMGGLGSEDKMELPEESAGEMGEEE